MFEAPASRPPHAGRTRTPTGERTNEELPRLINTWNSGFAPCLPTVFRCRRRRAHPIGRLSCHPTFWKERRQLGVCLRRGCYPTPSAFIGLPRRAHAVAAPWTSSQTFLILSFAPDLNQKMAYASGKILRWMWQIVIEPVKDFSYVLFHSFRVRSPRIEESIKMLSKPMWFVGVFVEFGGCYGTEIQLPLTLSSGAAILSG